LGLLPSWSLETRDGGMEERGAYRTPLGVRVQEMGRARAWKTKGMR
jgi:hypothetical protein